jgi:sulfopyruvate decarboxylase subunit beta
MKKTRRYELLQAIAPLFTNELIVCNIGFPSQELYAIRDSARFFYMLGSMGLSSSIGLGLSKTTTSKVIAIDGDGSVLMNLGTLATIANHAPANFILLIVDNGAYGSTGDQPTHTAGKTDLAAMAKGAGIFQVHETENLDAVATLKHCLATDGPHVIVAKVAPGSPKLKPIPLAPTVIRDRFRAEV